MPVYEYRCTSCGKEFEKMQRFSDPPVETCADCGGPVKKLISQTSFILKGSGWYVTDYGRKGQTQSASRSEKQASSESENTSSKSDKTDKSDKSDTSTSTSKDGASTDKPSASKSVGAAA